MSNNEYAPPMRKAEKEDALKVLKSYAPREEVSSEEARAFAKKLFRLHFGMKRADKPHR